MTIESWIQTELEAQKKPGAVSPWARHVRGLFVQLVIFLVFLVVVPMVISPGDVFTDLSTTARFYVWVIEFAAVPVFITLVVFLPFFFDRSRQKFIRAQTALFQRLRAGEPLPSPEMIKTAANMLRLFPRQPYKTVVADHGEEPVAILGLVGGIDIIKNSYLERQVSVKAIEEDREAGSEE